MPVERAERIRKLPPYLYVEIRQRMRAAQARGVDVISLGAGDPDIPTPPHILDALARAVADPANHRYPPFEQRGLPEFRASVSRWYGRRFGVELDPEREVLALIGSKEGNHHLALALLDPGDVALVPDPGYPAYAASVTLAGGENVTLPLRRENGFLPDFDEVPTDIARRAKIMWLCYPNNPTAAVAPLDTLRRAVAFAKRHDLVIAYDNPYSEIAFDGLRVHSILEVDGAKDVTVEFNSLSKPFNMTGWRIGMAVGAAGLIAAILEVKENTDTGVFAAVQHAAIAALDGPRDFVARNIEVYRRRRDVVVDTLRRLGLDVAVPKATFYVWSPVPRGLDSMSFAARLIDLTGVVVTPGIGYGKLGEGYMRISLSIPDDRLQEAMHRIEKVRDQLVTPLAPVS